MLRNITIISVICRCLHTAPSLTEALWLLFRSGIFTQDNLKSICKESQNSSLQSVLMWGPLFIVSRQTRICENYHRNYQTSSSETKIIPYAWIAFQFPFRFPECYVQLIRLISFHVEYTVYLSERTYKTELGKKYNHQNWTKIDRFTAFLELIFGKNWHDGAVIWWILEEFRCLLTTITCPR